MYKNTRIAITTCTELPDLFGGERLLQPALEKLGFEVSIQVWNAAIDWSQFDVVIIRCTWDYHEKLAAFLEWLDQLKHTKCLVLNALEILQWNLDKRYLFELERKGARIIPGVCLEPHDERQLLNLMDEMGTDEIVVKPIQSAGAWRTLRLHRSNCEESSLEFEQWRREQAFLVQAFMPEIVNEGEWSLVFFNGEYSHSLLKRAKAGDFRVQSDHGGSVQKQEASAAMKEQAAAVLKLLPSMPCYARVDGICRDDQFYLMELELLEPELFLEIEVQAPQRFAQAIKHSLEHSLEHSTLQTREPSSQAC